MWEAENKWFDKWNPSTSFIFFGGGGEKSNTVKKKKRIMHTNKIIKVKLEERHMITDK